MVSDKVHVADLVMRLRSTDQAVVFEAAGEAAALLELVCALRMPHAIQDPRVEAAFQQFGKDAPRATAAAPGVGANYHIVARNASKGEVGGGSVRIDSSNLPPRTWQRPFEEQS